MLELKLEPYTKDMTKLREVLVDTVAGARVNEGWLLAVSKMLLKRGFHFVPGGSLVGFFFLMLV